MNFLTVALKFTFVFRCLFAVDCWEPVKSVPTVSAQDRWSYIVTGESGGQWPEGSQLIAWTLKAWTVYRGMPPELAGPRWGWNGWRSPTREAWQVVHDVWSQPPTNAPFDFMQSGKFCALVGSDNDLRYWRWIHWAIGTPNFILSDPNTGLHMNCFWG